MGDSRLQTITIVRSRSEGPEAAGVVYPQPRPGSSELMPVLYVQSEISVSYSKVNLQAIRVIKLAYLISKMINVKQFPLVDLFIVVVERSG